MRRFSWTAQNDTTDENGFFLQDEAAFAAERAALAEMGAPETDAIVFEKIEATDRDEAECLALVPEAFADWAFEQDIPCNDF
jgi:hypothetical protein